MFIIIDSDNSFVFQHIPRYFGQPLVVLMSPQDVPPAFQGRRLYFFQYLLISKFGCPLLAEVQHHGSLFTLFLHSPLTALCYICNVGDVPIHHWERCQSYVDHFITEASRLVTRCRIDEIDQGYIGKNGRCMNSFEENTVMTRLTFSLRMKNGGVNRFSVGVLDSI